MDGDPSQRREKRSKGNHDLVDREIRGLVFESYRVAMSSKGTTVSRRSMAEAAKKLNLEEAVGKAAAVVLVMAVLAMGLGLDMEKDLPMMEEEKGRPYLQLER